MKIRNLTYSIVWLLISTLMVNAQSIQENSNKWSLGLQVGHLYDLGEYRFDKSPEEDFRGLNGENTRFDLGAQLYLERQFTPLWGLQFNGAYGTITGSNSIEYYEGEFYSASVDGLFVLSNLMASNDIQEFRYYLKGGLGLGSFESNQYLILDSSPDNSQSGIFGQYRMGAGLQYQLNSSLRLEFEVMYTTILNDGFDGYNNASGRDALLNSSVGIAYTFGSREQNPLFSTSSFSQEYIGYAENSESNEQESLQPESSVSNAQMDSVQRTVAELSEHVRQLERQLEEQRNLLNQQSSEGILSEERVSVFFDFDDSGLSREEKAEIFNWVSQLGELEAYTFEITAYTDDIGSEEYNLLLRQRRAESIQSFLTSLGVSESQILILETEDSDDQLLEPFLERRAHVTAKPVNKN